MGVAESIDQPQAPNIKDLRARADQAGVYEKQVEELSARLQEMEAKATELEREKMSVLERIDAEKKDLQKQLEAKNQAIGQLSGLEPKLQNYTTAFEDLYTQRLAQVPDEYREKMATLSALGDWPDRVKSLDVALTIIPQPGSTGTQAQPPTNSAPPKNPAAAKAPGVLDVVKNGVSASGLSALLPRD